MNREPNGNVTAIYKDRVNTRIAPKPEPKPQRRALGHPSALDGRSTDEVASPATIGDVLEGLDAAVAIRSDIDRPLKVRLGRLESDVGELRSELATAQATIARLETLVTALRSAMPNPEVTKLRIAAEVKIGVATEVKSYFEAMSKRAAARRAAQKATK